MTKGRDIYFREKYFLCTFEKNPILFYFIKKKIWKKMAKNYFLKKKEKKIKEKIRKSR